MATLRNKKGQQAIKKMNTRKSLGAISNGTQLFPEFSRNILLKCQKKQKREWQKISLRNWIGQKAKVWCSVQVRRFSLNPQVQVNSGCDPQTSRNSNRKNQETTEVILKSVLLSTGPLKSETQKRRRTINSYFMWISAVHNWKIHRRFRENQLWILPVQRWFS